MGVQGHAVYESRVVPQVVATFVRDQLQDADLGCPRTEGLPARCVGRVPAVYDFAAARSSVKNAVFPRRRPLGAEAAEFAALVQDGERLGRSVGETQPLASKHSPP